MTVLGTTVVTTAGNTKQVLVYLVDRAELRLAVVPTFPWADMLGVSYLPEIAAKLFPVTLGRLHVLLKRVFEAGANTCGGQDLDPVDCADYFSNSEKDAEKSVVDQWWAPVRRMRMRMGSGRTATRTMRAIYSLYEIVDVEEYTDSWFTPGIPG